MNLFNIYKNSFEIVAKNPAITLFLVAFLIASNLLAGFMFTSNTKLVATIISFCLFMLSLCFVSGWLNVIKDVSKNGSKEKNYFPIFLEGIGKNIIPIGIGSFIYTLILVFVLFLTGKIAHNLFGSLDFILKDLVNLAQDNNALMEYFEKLTDNQKYIVYMWQISFILSSMIFNFVMLFYFPAIIFNEKSNVFFKALVELKDSIVFLFKNFINILFIYICIYSVYAFLGILKAMFSSNMIVSILLLFFYIYFICGAVMLIFNYYEKKNNCADGANCIRENENFDKSSEEN